MRCGTAPTHIFRLPFNVDVIDKIRIIYSQDNKKVFTKKKEDCTFEGNVVRVKLTQEDTLALNYRKYAEVQIRIVSVSGDPLASTIKAFLPARCLEDEVI